MMRERRPRIRENELKRWRAFVEAAMRTQTMVVEDDRDLHHPYPLSLSVSPFLLLQLIEEVETSRQRIQELTAAMDERS